MVPDVTWAGRCGYARGRKAGGLGWRAAVGRPSRLVVGGGGCAGGPPPRHGRRARGRPSCVHHRHHDMAVTCVRDTENDHDRAARGRHREGPRAWERRRHTTRACSPCLPLTRACVFVFVWAVVANQSIRDAFLCPSLTPIPNPPTPPLRPPSFPALSSSRLLTSSHDRPRPFDHRSAPGDVNVCLAFERQRGTRPVSGRRHT